MTIFIILCVAMVFAALAFIVRPLIKTRATFSVALVSSMFIAVVAAGMYAKVGHSSWERDQALVRAADAARQDLAANIARLEQTVRESPGDLDAAFNLAEALLEQDERSIDGRAGELIERVLAGSPNNAKALWYGAIGALTAGKLPLARERLQKILALAPPENVRAIIERQIQDIGQQLGEQQAGAGSPAAGKSLAVEVSIAPESAKGLAPATAVFILARDPVNAGPPLAAVRRTVSDLPLKISLTDKDAMMAGRGISTVGRVQVVARVSQSGAPQAQPGDLFGEAIVDTRGAEVITVKITIDKKVAK